MTSLLGLDCSKAGLVMPPSDRARSAWTSGNELRPRQRIISIQPDSSISLLPEQGPRECRQRD
ncbi:hypothetical protein J6590_023430 [Homalodisca vitripennis]|nr:hypothetical protein J6590_023430 [Homalodisca vitripennis]